jgi:hypothetical protein
MLDSSDINILEEIVAADGDCLKSAMCSVCPFAKKCLPQFLKPRNYRPSREERANMALDTLAKHALFDDDQEFVRG